MVGKAAGIAYFAERLGQPDLVSVASYMAGVADVHARRRAMLPLGTQSARILLPRRVAEAPCNTWNASGRVRKGFPAPSGTRSARTVVSRGPVKKPGVQVEF